MESVQPRLNLPHNLARTVHTFFQKQAKTKTGIKYRKELLNIGKNIDIWLKFYPRKFKEDFYTALNISGLSNLRYQYPSYHRDGPMKKELDAYISKLVKDPSFKIFIGKDAYILYQKYKEAAGDRKGDCYFIPYSRSFLFTKSNDNNYIALTELIHQDGVLKGPFSAYYQKYRKSLMERGEFYHHIRKKSLSILKVHHLIEKLNEYKSFLVIDSGMQGGLALPLTVVLREEGYRGRVSLFFCFPWLAKLYKGKIQTHDINVFVQLEHLSMHEYAKAGCRATG